MRDTAGDEIEFYLEFRGRASKDGAGPLQVASSGFSYEELKIIKQSYLEVRDRLIGTQRSSTCRYRSARSKALAGTHRQSGITGSF